MTRPELKIESRRIVEGKLKMLDKAMERRLAMAHEKMENEQKKDDRRRS